MVETKLADVLRSLATNDKTRSETARLRDVFHLVEAALNAGVKRKIILQALKEDGFKMTLSTFDGAMHRIRKQNGKPNLRSKIEPKQAMENGKKQASKVATPDLNNDLDDEEKPAEIDAHDPAALSKIMSAPVDLEILSKSYKRKKP